MSSPVNAVALGGGHGLHASLSALRRITAHLTAIVTVADDGGSSGRIRRELPVLPPGDLRMALVALAGQDPAHRHWADALQHRIGGDGALAGHPLGNLLLTALLEQEADAPTAIATVADLLGAVGRVLPMSPVPLDLVARADRFDPEDPDRSREIRGQSSIAATPGRVRSIRLLPAGAPACAAAVDAVRAADLVVLGPGSWFTSVIPHLLLRELGTALARTEARIVVVLNLVPQVGETDDYSPVDLLTVLLDHAEANGGLRIDAVVADPGAVPDVRVLADFCARIAARLLVSELTTAHGDERHDPTRLSEALNELLSTSRRGEVASWR
ncbi:MAG: uridine diphosphate-N-acetylglucosamine-binding protein YvcK [Jatrophihabitans sp.]|nr:MAG: uridine diphosphate-N-acetylglucosamine-binding protein YvcK [Jatrophihabitans sp.]